MSGNIHSYIFILTSNPSFPYLNDFLKISNYNSINYNSNSCVSYHDNTCYEYDI